MTRKATEPHPHPFASMIHHGWKESGLPLSQVVFRYKTEALARGYGNETKGDAAVKRWCYGWSIPQLHQYHVLAGVLNAALSERGKSLLPVFDTELAYKA